MSILLPLDVTAPTLATLPFAIQLALVLSESIFVFHTAQGPPPLWMLERMHRLTGPIQEAGVTHHLRLNRGDPAQTICQEADRRQCDWIVLGAGAVPLGPVTSAVFSGSTVPTLAVEKGGQVRLRSIAEADRLCSTLSTTGTAAVDRDHVVLSLPHPPLEHAI